MLDQLYTFFSAEKQTAHSAVMGKVVNAKQALLQLQQLLPVLLKRFILQLYHHKILHNNQLHHISSFNMHMLMAAVLNYTLPADDLERLNQSRF